MVFKEIVCEGVALVQMTQDKNQWTWLWTTWLRKGFEFLSLLSNYLFPIKYADQWNELSFIIYIKKEYFKMHTKFSEH
jgi:hypothetical protein